MENLFYQNNTTKEGIEIFKTYDYMEINIW